MALATQAERASDRVGAAGGRFWRCTCGQLYRVHGLDRHRVYWPDGTPPNEPVMDGCCVNCGRPLPGKHPHCLER